MIVLNCTHTMNLLARRRIRKWLLGAGLVLYFSSPLIGFGLYYFVGDLACQPDGDDLYGLNVMPCTIDAVRWGVYGFWTSLIIGILLTVWSLVMLLRASGHQAHRG